MKALQFIENDVVTSSMNQRKKQEIPVYAIIPRWQHCFENFARCHTLHTCLYSLVVVPLEVTSNIKTLVDEEYSCW